MKAFILTPTDPLVFGTGKPFTAVPGARNDSAPMPPPSTLAGFVRTQAGLDKHGQFDKSRIPTLLENEVLGPLLAVLPQDGQGNAELAVVPPADALRLACKDAPAKHCIRRLHPLELEEGDAVSGTGLPVGQPNPDRSKPPRNAPAYWRWSQLLSWLSADGGETRDQEVDAHEGVHAPTPETRLNVRISEDGTADDGGLFGTTGRRFRSRVDGAWRDLAIYGETDATLPLPLRGVLGGEGRLSAATESPRLLPDTPPDAVLASARAGHVRVYLLTPAPLGGSTWDCPFGTVIAQAHGRPDVISGWAHSISDTPPLPGYDPVFKGHGKTFARKPGASGPKPIRRLLPAGTVFFVKLDQTGDAAAQTISDWWTRSIAAGQDARDGFGRILFGAWNGATPPLQIRGS